MKKSILVVSVLISIFLTAFASALACGDTIYSDTILTEDLTGCFNGVFVGADNITLDCDGYAISGGGGFGDNGILIDSKESVTIKNCEIKGFFLGVSLLNSSKINVTNNILFQDWLGIGLEYASTNNNFWNSNTGTGFEK